MNAFQNYPLLVGKQTNLYKCVLANGLDMMGADGYMGLLTPESIYDDPKGQPLRRELYKHLQYHFQYQNELRLFAEVDHHTVYGGQLLRKRTSSPPRFASLNDLFHPNTVDACFSHDGHGLCGGIKDENDNWNTKAHKERIVYYGEKELKILSAAFEDGEDWESVKLTSLHSNEAIPVLEKLSKFPKHIRDYNVLYRRPLDETNDQKAGKIRRDTCFPNVDEYQMIFAGPHIGLANPISKTPREICKLNSDYDEINLNEFGEELLSFRTNYVPNIPLEEWKNSVKGYEKGQDENGDVLYDNWLDYYKLGFKEFVGSSSERTLSGTILFPEK